MSNPMTNRPHDELRGVLIRWAMLIALVGVFAIWATCRMNAASKKLAHTKALNGVSVANAPEPTIEYWTCTMHPEIKQSEPGDCPTCGMELVPKYKGSSEPGVKPAQSTTDMRSHAHAGRGTETTTETSTKSRDWFRCTMPECGDQGSADPNSRCPVCGMKRERVEVDHGGEDAGDFEIALSERARRLAEVETVQVKERLLQKEIRTVGRATYDETRYKMVSAWIGGRIDNLYADFTGMLVNNGDHLVEIYSPDLLSAQEEYLQAIRAVNSNRGTRSTFSEASNQQILDSARRKLELLGISKDQIAAIERSDEPQTHLVIHAPIGGTIVKKQAMEGMYVKTGDPLYTIADLTHLWLLVDLFESDLPWVKAFQDVRLTTRSLPGEVFTGQIVFVDPRVDPQTRTVPVRIHVENPELRLKPDMWLTAEIDAGLAGGGVGAVPRPKGEYVCPMHPWEASDSPGNCPICDMKFVAVEKLPQYQTPTKSVPILSVPRGAVMQTGERALVYVESSPAVYRGVELNVGPLAHDEFGNEFFAVLSGLSGGEQVVVRGNFAIDSQMQLAGKPSLFSARGFGQENEITKEELKSTTELVHPETNADEIVQTQCPVMGGKINPEVFIEYKGVKVYFCCPGCDGKFVEEPEKYISKLPDVVQKKIRQHDAKGAANG